MKTYLDSMVTSTNSDSDLHDQHLVYHLAMFKQNTTQKQNHLDKHLMMINSECSDMLQWCAYQNHNDVIYEVNDLFLT